MSGPEAAPRAASFVLLFLSPEETTERRESRRQQAPGGGLGEGSSVDGPGLSSLESQQEGPPNGRPERGAGPGDFREGRGWWGDQALSSASRWLSRAARPGGGRDTGSVQFLSGGGQG